jgi:hypothetical protein
MKTSPIKEVAPLFLTQHYSFNYKKKCKLQSIHYRTVSKRPLGTVADSLGSVEHALGTTGLKESLGLRQKNM